MSIFLNNYEEWFLDYHEGNLNDKQKELVLKFLEQNPNLYEEFNAFDSNIVLNKSNVTFNYKENLKAPTANDFDELLVSYIEDELSFEEKIKTDELIKGNKKMEVELSFLKKTILTPDLSIVYPEKEKLKKGNKGIIRLIYYTSAAAAACLLFLFSNMSNLFNDNTGLNQISNVSSDSLQLGQTQGYKLIKKQLTVSKKNKESEKGTPIIDKKKKKKSTRIIKASDSTLNDGGEIIQPVQSEEESILAHQDVSESDTITETPLHQVDEVLVADNNTSYLNERTPAMTEPENKFLTPKELLIQQLKKITAETNKTAEENNTKLSLWEIAEVGTSSISKFTGKKIKVSHNSNEEEGLFSFAIITDRFGFSRSSSK